MKRKLKCSTCGTTTNTATGKPLYLLGSSDASLMLLPAEIECWECGEKRRDADQKRKTLDRYAKAKS